MLIKLLELPRLKLSERDFTGSIFAGKESRLKSDVFPITLFFGLWT
jgi:hypothetical protein